MDEQQAIAGVDVPATTISLTADLAALGVRPGETLLVHSSLSALGWVSGGGVAVATALLDALGPAGTLVVPAHSGDLSDPADWAHPPVPSAWWDTIRATMPAFHPRITPTRGMGVIAEIVRGWPGAVRSDHPQVSFAAVGPGADAITADHGLAYGLGEDSPLARLYDVDARVLLLGVGYDRNTSFHLAEYRSGVRPHLRQAGPVVVDGARVWTEWADLDLDETDFPAIGAALEKSGAVTVGRVGRGAARLFAQRAGVELATRWFVERA